MQSQMFSRHRQVPTHIEVARQRHAHWRDQVEVQFVTFLHNHLVSLDLAPRKISQTPSSPDVTLDARLDCDIIVFAQPNLN